MSASYCNAEVADNSFASKSATDLFQVVVLLYMADLVNGLFMKLAVIPRFL
jgi:hypothetical protein